jgi:myo-inositol 2-dehydrogenase/D-chiro-inositol 1-dehydrogenase
MWNIALIGAGAIGKIHACNIVGHPKARLSYVCDTNAAAGESVAAEYGCRAVAFVDEALGSEVDAIVIASSTATHGDIARACIDAGKPFLCEKPLASDLSTAREMADLVRNSGLIAGMAFNRRLHPQYAGIKQAVAAGEIGRVESMLITSRTAAAPTLEFIKTSGGLFGEKGSHFYDLARWIMGEHPVELFAMGGALVNPRFADIDEVDTAMITMRFPSGALCLLDFSWRAAYGQDERMEVMGSLGMLQTQQSPVGPFLRFTPSGMTQDGPMPTWYERFEETYALELDLFFQALESGQPGELPTLADGVAAQQVADAARRSVQEGRPVNIAHLG